jgi:hypothetical protein
MLRNAWSENDGHRVKPRFGLAWASPELVGVRVKCEPLRNTDDADFSYIPGMDGRSGGEITLGWRSILEADSVDTLRLAAETLFEHVIHETAHIDFPGTSIDEQGGDREGAVKYLCHPGEMCAHAKEYAFKYRRTFPGEPFDLEKMRSIISTNDERNYLIQFADPDKQAAYRSVADLASVHATMAKLVGEFVEHFQRSEREASSEP